jgi:hypothetical protein
LPRHFEQAASMVEEDHLAQAIVCGPDPQRHMERVGQYVDAGFDHVFIHQVGPDQSSGLEFYAREVLPRFTETQARKAGWRARLGGCSGGSPAATAGVDRPLFDGAEDIARRAYAEASLAGKVVRGRDDVEHAVQAGEGEDLHR